MKQVLLWFAIAAILIICLLLYRSHSGSRLNIDPHASEQIEKAKGR